MTEATEVFDNGTALAVPFDLPDAMVAATAPTDVRPGERRVKELAQALWLPEEFAEPEWTRRKRAAAAALQGLAPRDELEGMLAAQMVATHSAAMDCLRRAYLTEKFEVRHANLQQGTRLLGMYTKQMEALTATRDAAQRRATVEHVRVESGEPAIAGHVGGQ